jgi:hypothetical protein
MATVKIPNAVVVRFSEILREATKKHDQCLRLVYRKGPELIVDQVRSEDDVLEYNGEVLLAIGPLTMKKIDGRVFEVDSYDGLTIRIR